jgi:hypothetical protein
MTNLETKSAFENNALPYSKMEEIREAIFDQAQTLGVDQDDEGFLSDFWYYYED